ncbi:MAG: reverse transcriptase domain-containing protein [Pseudomonas gingeri]
MISSKTGVTPYESLYGKAPSAKHWGVFGCDTWLHIPKEQRTTLASKAEPCIYLGHSGVQNCARVYVLRTRKIVASRDVTFRPASFTFSRAMRKGDVALAKAVDDFGAYEIVDEPLGDTNDDDVDTSNQHSSSSRGEVHDVEPQWELESIKAQRVHGRTREHQFKCSWSGDYDDTWEPAEQIRIDAPLIVEEFLASVPSPMVNRTRAALRRRDKPVDDAPEVAVVEPRAHHAVQVTTVVDRESDDDDDDSAAAADSSTPSTSQVHLVMSALRTMQPPHSRVSDDDAMLFAVKSGIANLELQTPQTYRQAMSGPDALEWQASMDKEYNSCLDKEVWEEVRVADLPPGTNILPAKWVYKIKVDETGAELANGVGKKSRVTPKGYLQKHGRDYFEVFARTGMYKTMRFGLSLAAKWDHEIEQQDVPTAFLNADLKEDVYMQIPEGRYRDGKAGIVLRLKKSLYGLKQSPRNWYILVSTFVLTQLGFKATVSDPCLFWKRSHTGRLMMMFLFVDDFQTSFHRDDRNEWNGYKAQLVKQFNTKDMGESKWMLGMRITRDRTARTITLDQEVYITKALEKYGYNECTTRPTPEVVGAAHQEPTEEQRRPCDRQRYMEIVGTLMYAAISTRLDIAHAVFYLACHMLAPSEMHMTAAERVLRYLSGTRGLGLAFGTRNGGVLGDSRGQTRTQVEVIAFGDADWANSRGDRRSITGWVAKTNDDPISWASKKQRTVALSTCEAELYAEAAAIQEVLWLRGLLKELGLQSQVGSLVFGDNQSTIAVTKNGIKGERTKHVDVKYHFVTETVERGDVTLKWIPTAEQQADIFTKALPQPTFETLRAQLMMQQ